MLFYKPHVLRLIASWLLVQTSTQLVWPTVSYALTAGPTAPEATSFEPVDTTDMVNLTSGDLTYNIPLLEVPGPEGGYPLSLAYHAGIQPDVESSWVGLGWSLNPGAINRNVNGYADDQQGAGQVVRDYWQGGSQTTYKVGVGVGLGQCASVSAGLSFSNDTYRGFGVGGYAGVGVGLVGNDTGSIGLSASVSVDGYGNAGAGISVGVSTKGAVSAGASIGVSTNFNSISANAGGGISVSAGGDDKGRGRASNSLLGASISSDGGKFSVRGPGGSYGIHNTNAGRIQTQSDGATLDIPIPGTPVFVELGYDYTRYWSDETDLATVNGSLYYPLSYDSRYMSQPTNTAYNLDKQAFDTYRVTDPQSENIIDNPDPNWLQGGSFSDYDNYMVVAQGLAGSMRPYAFQRALYSRNQQASDGSYDIKDMPLSWTNKPTRFRFDGDFSNAYLQENGAISTAAYTFGTPTYGNSDGNYGYDPASDRLAGSKHIEYYTNNQILDPNGHPGFIDTDAKGFNRATAVAEHPELATQIGGFSITNSSGVTYHFALPAYSFDEYTFTRAVDASGNYAGSYNELQKNSYYAYTWFLTAITGPDYVDRNTTGVDATDWGYWIKFNYGKWSNHYGWRNPGVGYRSDVDAKLQTYSAGRKEVYYINSISTRTHTALFEKELRNDGRGACFIESAPIIVANSKAYFKDFPRILGPNEKASIYNYAPGSIYYSFYISNFFKNDAKNIITNESDASTANNGGRILDNDITEDPVASLRLKSVTVIKNEDLAAISPSLESLSSAYDSYNSQTFETVASNGNYYKMHLFLKSQLGFNVFDVNDANSVRDQLINKSLRTINFNYDYSLVPNTPNSYAGAKLSGKLTLKSIAFLGTNGTSVLPPTQFGYEQDPGSKQGSLLLIKDNSGQFAPNNIGLVQSQNGIINSLPTTYEPGDILRFQQDGVDKYLTILDQVTNSAPIQYHVRYLSDVSNSSMSTVFAQATKNPPYLSDYHDWWGMLKSDYNPALTGVTEGIARRTTALSNKCTDAWSLRSITSPLGAKITVTYEGDQYANPVLSRPDMICKPLLVYAGNNPQQMLLGLPLNQAQTIFPPKLVFYQNGLAPYDTIIAGSKVTAYKTMIGVESVVESVKVDPNNSNQSVVAFRPGPNSIGYTGQFWSGSAYLTLPKSNTIIEGGGLRVKQVAIASGGITHSTNYNYNKLYSNQTKSFSLPSGVTAYEPGNVLRFNKDDIQPRSSGHPNAAEILDFKQRYSASLYNLFAISRELPAPGVMYEAVTVKESIVNAKGIQIDAPNSDTYRFKVFKPNMIGRIISRGQGANRLYTSNVTIKDYTSRIGSLLSSTHYGADGRKLSETVNHFLYDELDNASFEANSDPGSAGYQAKMARFNYQGIIQESFADSRDCRSPNDGNYDHKVVMSKRDMYPTIQTSTTTTNFVTGLSTTAETLGFDFYSGTATRTLSTDGYGNRFLTEVTPAYRKYPVMGLKSTTLSNRNMLSQTAATTTYKVNAANAVLGVMAASVQTWSNQVPVIGLADGNPENIGTQAGSNGNGDVWRPWQSYSWLPTGTTVDGLTPVAGSNSFVGYDFSATSQAGPWKLTSQTTLYNPYSNALEAKDINNIPLATKLGFSQSKVLVSGGPASYQELAYSGAEEVKAAGDYFSGGIAVTWAPDNALPSGGGPWGSGDVERSTTKAHTGKASLRIGSYKHGFSYGLNASASDPTKFRVDPTKPYRVSVWTDNPGGQLYYWLDGTYSPVISGTAQKRTADGWYLVELTIPPIGPNRTTLRIGCYNSNGTQSVYFDDFRVQPVNAQVNSYVYDQLTGQVTDILDNSNLYTHYDYTSDGKLKRVSHETFQYGAKKVAEHFYHLAGIMDAVSLDTSVPNTMTVVVPEAADPTSIMYDIGDGRGYQSLNTSTRPYTFSTAYGSYTPLSQWVKVKVTDGQGNVRELVTRLR